MNKIRIVSNKPNSPSLKLLSQVLTEKVRYKVWRSNRHISNKDFVVYTGISKVDQLSSFTLAGVPCPKYTTDKLVAEAWLRDDVKRVMCRKLTRAHSGKGCVVANNIDELVQAPLYTAYVPKKFEYRVHVFNGKVIDKQIKRKRKEYEGTRDTQIRNKANGYVFCREGITDDPRLESIAIAAVKALSRPYGAVDIIYNEKQDSYFVLEVNSKPGMQGTTLEKYAQAIINRS